MNESEITNPFEYFFEHIIDGIVLTDRYTKRFTLCNSAFSRMLGYSKDEIMSLGVSDVHPKSVLARVEEEFNRLDEQKIDLVKDIPVLRKDGTVFYADISASPITYMGKKLILGTLRDVTERKKNEEALEHNEELLRTAFNTTADGVLVVDRNGKISQCNSQFIDMWRIPGELLAHQNDQKLLEFVADQLADPVEFRRKVEDLYNKRMKQFDELVFKDGRVFERYTSPIMIHGTDYGQLWDFRDISKKRQADKLLMESEARFRTLFEEAAVAIGISRGENLIFVNKRFLKIFGYNDINDVVGKPFMSFVAPESLEDIRLRHARTPYARTMYDPSEFEADMVRSDGSRFTIHAAVSTVSLPDGMASLAFISDVTERNVVQAALQEREMQLSEINRMVQLGHWVWDIATGKVEWSDEVYRIFHRDPQTFTPQIDSIMALSPWSEDHNRSNELIKKAIASHEKGSYEQRFLRPDNSIGYYQSTFQGKYDDHGVLVEIVGTIMDITDRKRVEEAHRQNEAILKSIFNTAAIGLCLLNGEKYVKVNTAFCRILGYQDSEIIGNDTWFCYPDIDEYHHTHEVLLAQMDKDGVGICECRLRRKDGMMVDVLECLSPFDQTDSSAGRTLAVIDITGQKAMEREKARLEEMLLHSQKLDSIGRLAGGIAHDFNNLLTAIIGNTDLAMCDLDPNGTTYAQLSVVMKAAEGAANLTRQLLAFSRKQVVAPKVMNINAIIDQIKKTILTLIGENVRLNIVQCTDAQCIKADPGQIEQIIINLAVNARDAMPDGGVLTIETMNVVLDEEYSRQHVNVVPGDYVQLVITDSGVGMSKDVLNHLFEPFYTTKELGKGTGLGLATVYGIVNQYGGSVEVYSEIGRGTSFKLYFPAAQHLAVENSQNHSRSELPSGTETILITEDNPAVLTFAANVLQRAGYKVLTASSGEDALTTADEYRKQIHLLITDIILPGINGRVAADKFAEKYPSIKVLFTSGYTAEVIDKGGFLEPGINFISKPFTSMEIALKVRDVLDK
jgi:two-component system, cell cycle sensor histidine kinase and response regulator CckA